tara:strand:+ start:140 stop:415 length:276 start_codon:yes stop_codon:yes gene_type:complete
MLLKVPKYNYKCSACGHLFTERHAMSEAAQECPVCFGEELLKLPSSFKIIGEVSEQDSKTGSVVQKSIKEIRDEVRMEKEKLKNRLWSDNE